VRRLERFVIAAALGGVPPIAGLIAGWWGSVPLLPEHWIWLSALLGLLAGVTVDVIWLRRWVLRAADLAWWIWALVYGFYAVGIFGLFMGVPLFNVALGLPAGVVVGCRLARSARSSDDLARASRRASAFTTGVLGLICTASALIALSDPWTADNLRGLLGLRFEVTSGMIIGLILVGGAGLLATEWGVTALMIRWAQRSRWDGAGSPGSA
jgi:hypothetical protein